jgi:hypothetical protein
MAQGENSIPEAIGRRACLSQVRCTDVETSTSRERHSQRAKVLPLPCTAAAAEDGFEVEKQYLTSLAAVPQEPVLQRADLIRLSSAAARCGGSLAQRSC